MKMRFSKAAWAAVCASFSLCSAAGATVFTTVADSSTPVPGGTGNFVSFSPTSVNFDGSSVSFIGGNPDDTGFYEGLSSLSVIADDHTTVPGTTFSFASFGGLGYSNGNAVLEGGTSPSAPGIYVRPQGGTLSTVADTNTTLPGGSVKFTSFGNTPTVSSSGVAFIGNSTQTTPSSGGIYTTIGGTLRAVVDTNTTVPGGTLTFTSFLAPDVDGNTIVYGGRSSGADRGIFLQTGTNTPTVVANQNTPVPNSTGNFTFFSDPSIDGSNVAFFGGGGSTKGIYAVINGQMTHVVDETTPAPGGGNFTAGIEGASISGNDVVFQADRGTGTTIVHGYYLYDNGAISKIVETGDTLDGKIISSLGTLNANGFSGSSVAFEANFTDGSEGVFLASVPEPTTLALAIPAAMALLGMRRRNR